MSGKVGINMKKMICAVLSIVILLSVGILTVFADLISPIEFSSRVELHNSVIQRTEEVETGTIRDMSRIEENARLETLITYIDFINIVDDVELNRIRVLPGFALLAYYDVTGEHGEDSLRISWTDSIRFGEDYDFLADRRRSIGSHRLTEINYNGNIILRQRFEHDGVHSSNVYFWTYNGYDISLVVPAWLLERHPEETFFDVQIVNIAMPNTLTTNLIKLNDRVFDLGTRPVVEEGRTLVPMRVIFEALDMDVEWENETRTAIGTRDDITIEIPIDSAIATVNGQIVELDVPAMIHNERTLVPLRFIAEATGAEVEWNDEMQTVVITTGEALAQTADVSIQISALSRLWNGVLDFFGFA